MIRICCERLRTGAAASLGMPIKLLLGARQPREVLRKDHNGAPPPPADADVDGAWLLRLHSLQSLDDLGWLERYVI
jgi:hypothetical protein